MEGDRVEVELSSGGWKPGTITYKLVSPSSTVFLVELDAGGQCLCASVKCLRMVSDGRKD